MSFEELGGHASEIVTKAQEWELRKRGYSEVDGGWVNYSGPGYTQDRVDADMAEISAKYEDVPELFTEFMSLPDPASFDAGIEDLRATMGRLSQGQGTKDPTSDMTPPANIVLDGMDTSQSYLARWTGIAASQFKANFVDTFESITTNQYLLAGYVKGALEAEKSLWHAARDNIDQIAESTITALDEMGDCGKNEWSVGLAVVGAVVAVAAVPFTAGGSLVAAATFAGIGGALSVGGAAAGTMEDPPEVSMSGESPEAVIGQMRETIGKLKDEIRNEEQKIADKMTELQVLVASHRELFVAPRPDLADTGPGDVRDDFGVPR